jgi:hypothetical protein
MMSPVLSAEREKTDIITLQNGDRVTGRILYAEFGYLHLNSAHAGTISIEWPSVRAITSQYAFRVERFGGLHYEGPITTGADGLIVGSGAAAVTVPLREVARLIPFESDFWQRIDGSVSIGSNFAKSSGIAQGSFGFDARYASAAVDAAMSASALVSRDSTGTTTDQDQLAGTVFFLQPSRNFWALLGGAQRDRSQGVDVRVVGGGGLGRRLLQLDSGQAAGIVGLVVNREWATADGSDRTSLEGVIGAEWRVYKFSYPKISLDSSLLLYPSLTRTPRYRGSLNVTLTFKLTDRFSLKLTEYGTYDSRPPSPGADTVDYGITTSIAYEFGAVVF